MTVLETTDLVKEYPRVRALDGLTIRVPEGVVGLLGPNGAGKSTLIKIVLGFLRPTAGGVRVLGLDPRKVPLSLRQKIGFMPEVESFIPGTNAVESVYLAARLTGLADTDAMQRTHMVLNYVGVNEERYRNLETYSTGMRQKVKFAQALVHHPDLLLLDEPTSGLDPRAREEMLGLIRDIAHGKGIHVLLSTHILCDVEEVCDEVVILHQGRLVRQDAVERLTAASDDLYLLEIKGDREGFLGRLRAEGLSPQEAEDGAIRLPAAGGTEPILRAAVAAGVQVRRLVHPQNRLEDLFGSLIQGA